MSFGACDGVGRLSEALGYGGVNVSEARLVRPLGSGALSSGT